MQRKFLHTAAALAVAALFASGCANYKEPAQAAINEAETSLQNIAVDAQKYAPDQYRAVADQLEAAKATFAKGDYKAALAGARDLPAKVAELAATTTAAKDQAVAAMTDEWNALSADVPKMVEAIQSRVDMLSKSRKLPKNIDKASFDAAKSGLESMKQEWTAATQASASGNVEEAVARVKAAQQKGNEVLGLLKMQPTSPG
jgi:outer membrane murein-binding lipoprotein Lpp